jgi:hypothetical protein
MFKSNTFATTASIGCMVECKQPIEICITYLLGKFEEHQRVCGELEEVEGKGVRCTKCGIMVTREDVPTLQGKGFIIEYR